MRRGASARPLHRWLTGRAPVCGEYGTCSGAPASLRPAPSGSGVSANRLRSPYFPGRPRPLQGAGVCAGAVLTEGMRPGVRCAPVLTDDANNTAIMCVCMGVCSGPKLGPRHRPRISFAQRRRRAHGDGYAIISRRGESKSSNTRANRESEGCPCHSPEFMIGYASTHDSDPLIFRVVRGLLRAPAGYARDAGPMPHRRWAAHPRSRAPPSGKGRIVLTSRFATWPERARVREHAEPQHRFMRPPPPSAPSSLAALEMECPNVHATETLTSSETNCAAIA